MRRPPSRWGCRYGSFSIGARDQVDRVTWWREGGQMFAIWHTARVVLSILSRAASVRNGIRIIICKLYVQTNNRHRIHQQKLNHHWLIKGLGVSAKDHGLGLFIVVCSTSVCFSRVLVWYNINWFLWYQLIAVSDHCWTEIDFCTSLTVSHWRF